MTFPLTSARASAAARRRVAAMREIRDSRLEDLIMIGGLAADQHEAARRIGVSERTIRYYRAELRRRAR